MTLKMLACPSLIRCSLLCSLLFVTECLQHGGASAFPSGQPCTVTSIQLPTKYHLLPSVQAVPGQQQEKPAEREWKCRHCLASGHSSFGDRNPPLPSDFPTLPKIPVLFQPGLGALPVRGHQGHGAPGGYGHHDNAAPSQK